MLTALQRSLAMNTSTRGFFTLLAPAKTLDMTSVYPDNWQTRQPTVDPDKTRAVADAVQAMSKADLIKTCKLSAKLGNIVYDTWQRFVIDDNNHKSTNYNDDKILTYKPAVFAFAGDVYQGLDVQSLFNDEVDKDTQAAYMDYMQANLRILNAVYGIVKPLDLIQAHRLEMQTILPSLSTDTKSSAKKAANLAVYWKQVVTNDIIIDLQDRPTPRRILNLASVEYTNAIDQASLQSSLPDLEWIQVVFKEADGRVVTIHTKKARGLLARHVVQSKATSLEDVQAFGLEGYKYVSDESTDSLLVFKRGSKAASTRTNNKTTTVKTNNKTSVKAKESSARTELEDASNKKRTTRSASKEVPTTRKRVKK
jgi:uncharacterized protein